MAELAGFALAGLPAGTFVQKLGARGVAAPVRTTGTANGKQWSPGFSRARAAYAR